ncbi:hypothetical protein OS493_039794 [Desmophyllum pertusum]|uniref:Uncharacterized protein n=1 Tax=Desmophyllum pertusum TaxID=174260 RepID=A0A9W9ZH46_9CNID|nr:hypothetical protein OS493_039794 [Desmophyllum pertusum]
MRKMPVMTWTGNIFAEKRFAWKWLVGQAGEEELPELDSQKSAMNAAGSDIMPELALGSGDREVAEIAAMAAAAIEEIETSLQIPQPSIPLAFTQTTTNPQQEPVAKETFTIKRG